MSHPLEECSSLLLLSSMVLQPGTVEGWREKVEGEEKDRERRKGRGENFCCKAAQVGKGTN